MSEILPPDKLPTSWNDEARLNVLFAPFRNRSVNSKDWESKMHFWKNLIFLYCTHHKKYSFTLPELKKIFTKNGRPPACLDVVVDDMFKKNEIKPLGVFLEKPAQGWGTWAAEVFVKKPIVWSFRKLKDAIAPEADMTYVHVEAIEKSANELIKSIPEDLKSNVIDLKELSDVLHIENNEHLQYLLHYLYCQGKICTKDLKANKEIIMLIKFCDNRNTIITDKDIDVFTLELSEKTLTKTIDKLEDQCDSLVKEIKTHLLNGKKQSAKTCLRKKHEIDRTIEKRANTLHNIQILISRLKDSDTDSVVLESYKKALASLRNTFNKNGLNEEIVTETMLDLEEVMDVQKDVQAAMVLQGDVANDRELEEELEDLLAEDQSNKGELSELKEHNDLEEQLNKLEIVDKTPDVSLNTLKEDLTPSQM